MVLALAQEQVSVAETESGQVREQALAQAQVRGLASGLAAEQELVLHSLISL